MKQYKLFTSFNEWEQAHKEPKKKKQTFRRSLKGITQIFMCK